MTLRRGDVSHIWEPWAGLQRGKQGADEGQVYGIGRTLWTVGGVVGFPVASALVANLAPAALRGRYQGAFAMCWGVAFTLSPLGAGEALQRRGGRTLWLLCLAVALAVAAGHVLTARPRRIRLAALASVEGQSTTQT